MILAHSTSFCSRIYSVITWIIEYTGDIMGLNKSKTAMKKIRCIIMKWLAVISMKALIRRQEQDAHTR